MSMLAPTLQAFFTDRLARQRQASPRTVAAYRDTFRLLLAFVQRQIGKAPFALGFEHLEATVIVAFLNHIEADRHNSPRTRNARLAAIRSFFRYAALRHPEHAAVIQQVLAIPQKRFDRAIVSFLTLAELDALVAAPDRTNWEGRRDYALLIVAVQTGLRVSELIGLNRDDVMLGIGAHVRCHGKGRKERLTPLSRSSTATLRVWLMERAGGPNDPVFPTRTGRRLTRRCHPASCCQARDCGRAAMLVAPVQAPHTTRPTTHGGHAAPPRRRRHVGDRLVARPRGHPVNADVPPRRHDHQRTCVGPHCTGVRFTWPLSCR